MRQLVLRLTLTTAVATIAAVVAAALILQLAQERARLRAAAEADLASLVSLVEATADEETLLRAMARSPAGQQGRLAVHRAGATVGTSRFGPVPAGPQTPSEVSVDGGTVLLRPVPDAAVPAVAEVFLPGGGPGLAELGWAAALLLAGAFGAAAGAVMALRRVRPVVADLVALATTAREIGSDAGADERLPRPRALPSSRRVPETVELAAALDALADRFAEGRNRERRLAADLSHRLRTPLTALALDAGAIGDGEAAERVRQTVASLNNDVDMLIRAVPVRESGPARCDVVGVVRRRMAFWSALAEHSGRACEFRTVDPPATTALAEDDLAAVVDALLGNVFRYTPDGTGFAVSVVRHAGWITLVVDDAGPGVADPVGALSRGVSSSGSTGLGLDIARDAVEATGGTIHVERAALGGGRIRLRFGEVGAQHADPDEPRAWRLWGSHRRRHRHPTR